MIDSPIVVDGNKVTINMSANDANIVAQLYANIENAIETINVSFIFKAVK